MSERKKHLCYHLLSDKLFMYLLIQIFNKILLRTHYLYPRVLGTVIGQKKKKAMRWGISVPGASEMEGVVDSHSLKNMIKDDIPW